MAVLCKGEDDEEERDNILQSQEGVADDASRGSRCEAPLEHECRRKRGNVPRGVGGFCNSCCDLDCSKHCECDN